MSIKDKKNDSLVNSVIDINDVEYVIDELAARLIEKGETDIALTRLFDKAVNVFSLKKIQRSLKEKGIIYHLD